MVSTLCRRPYPEHIHNLRGGYRGNLSQGIVITMFDFQRPFERSPFAEGYAVYGRWSSHHCLSKHNRSGNGHQVIHQSDVLKA